MPTIVIVVAVVAVALVVFLLATSTIETMQEHERGVIFRLSRLVGARGDLRYWRHRLAGHAEQNGACVLVRREAARGLSATLLETGTLHGPEIRRVTEHRLARSPGSLSWPSRTTASHRQRNLLQGG
jgi:hypothetical protein